MCSLLATGPSEGTFGQDEKNSTTKENKSVPMTANPSYGQIERRNECSRPLYGNL